MVDAEVESLACSICGKGTYSVEPSNICTICPAGRYNANDASQVSNHNELNDCTICAKGKYLADVGQVVTKHDEEGDSKAAFPVIISLMTPPTQTSTC